MRWFKALPIRRKILLFVSGGMATLAFDAFIAHFSWNNFTMRWTQAVPIVYALLAFVVLAIAAVFPLKARAENLFEKSVGAVGLIVGVTGVVLHGLTFFENMDGEPLTLVAIGKAMSQAAPPFAPGAFAVVGLLLVTLRSIAPRVEDALHIPHSREQE